MTSGPLQSASSSITDGIWTKLSFEKAKCTGWDLELFSMKKLLSFAYFSSILVTILVAISHPIVA